MEGVIEPLYLLIMAGSYTSVCVRVFYKLRIVHNKG